MEQTKTLTERVMDIITREEPLSNDRENMVEIKDASSLKSTTMRGNKGGIFDEEAFGTEWQNICKDYHGEEEYVPNISDEDMTKLGKGGYIKLVTPIMEADVKETDPERNPLSFDIIGVMPAVFRPIVKGEDGKLIIHPFNNIYSNIIMSNNRLGYAMKNNAPSKVTESQRKILIRNIRKLWDMIHEATSRLTGNAAMLFCKNINNTNVATSVEEIKKWATKMALDSLMLEVENSYGLAKRKLDDIIKIINFAKWRGMDIMPLKEELITAISYKESLKESVYGKAYIYDEDFRLDVYIDSVKCKVSDKGTKATMQFSTDRGEVCKFTIIDKDITSSKDMMHKYLPLYLDGMYSREDNKFVPAAECHEDMEGYEAYHLNYMDKYIDREFVEGIEYVPGYKIGSLNTHVSPKLKCTWNSVGYEEGNDRQIVDVDVCDENDCFIAICPPCVHGATREECIIDALEQIKKSGYYDVDCADIGLHDYGEVEEGHLVYDLDFIYNKESIYSIEWEDEE